MKRTEKVESVAELKERIQNNSVAILTHYIGIKANSATDLRRKLRDSGCEFKVFKNTLALRVLDDLGLTEAAAYLDGPTAWAFSNDPVAPAKVLAEFAKEAPMVSMNGGILDGRVVSKEQLEVLAKLPPREVLVSQVLGTMIAPVQNLVGVLQANIRNIASVLDQIRKQKEEADAAA